MNNKSRINLFSFIIIGILLLIVISAAPPFLSSGGSDTLQIASVINDSYKENSTILFPYHVFNQSNGTQMTNITTSCTFHLINSTGEHIFVNNFKVPYNSAEMEFEQIITSTNYSKPGEYTNMFSCNTSYNAGFTQQSYTILVPPSANPPSNLFSFDLSGFQNNIVLILMIGVAIVLFFTGQTTIAGGIVSLSGIIMAFNGVNLIFSILMITVGIIILLTEGKD